MTGPRGFTIVELLVAMTIMMVVMAATFGLMDPAQGVFAAQPEAVDLQQRLRVGVDGITNELMMAGAGPTTRLGDSPGPGFPAVLPYRIGAAAADSPGQYFTDRVTVLYVPPTIAQTRIADPITTVESRVSIAHDPGCPPADAACGFEKGMGAVVLDDNGGWDTFTVMDVQGSVLQLHHRGAQLNAAYDAGARISQVTTCTYWLRSDPVTDTYQLMRYDGNQSDLPMADNVVGLTFEYHGEPVGDGTDAESVVLTAAELTDGPWRPGAGAADRYDADLLRVRRIAVTLRVQAAAAFRGPAGRLFTRPGTSTRSERFLPDHEVRFDVAPRNLNLD